MKLIVSALTALVFLLATMPAMAGKPCATKDFKTDITKAACTKGGQDEAKKAWKSWLASVKGKNDKVKNCVSCHSKASGDYPLKPDGLKLYKDLGGK